jgi:hypothetical protein
MASAKNVLVVTGCFWILACQSYEEGGPRCPHAACTSSEDEVLLTFPAVFYFSDEEELLRIERDMNQDGSIDRWEYFEGSRPNRIELDSNYDGTVDLWAKIGPEGDVLEFRRDSDGDGLPDQIVSREEAPPVQVNPPFRRRLPRGTQCLHAQECSLSPPCYGYLKEISEQVYLRWAPQVRWSPQGDGEAVTVRFRISEDGHLSHVEIVRASNEHLGVTCLRAMEESAPFGPVPKECADLMGKALIATFRYRP